MGINLFPNLYQMGLNLLHPAYLPVFCYTNLYPMGFNLLRPFSIYTLWVQILSSNSFFLSAIHILYGSLSQGNCKPLCDMGQRDRQMIGFGTLRL